MARLLGQTRRQVNVAFWIGLGAVLVCVGVAVAWFLPALTHWPTV